MKLLLDMNLSPRWIQTLEDQGWETIHWTSVGDPRASDREIMQWARDHDHVVVTHDLDFGALLAATSAQKPSVIQVRTRDVMPEVLAPILFDALDKFKNELEEGALVVVEPAQARVRILPFE
jgi:predicted nuclease of predicted toxin-antitoxin system